MADVGFELPRRSGSTTRWTPTASDLDRYADLVAELGGRWTPTAMR